MENYVKNVASSYGRDSGAMMDEMLKLNGCESVAELQEKVANGESILEAADTAWNAGIQKQHYAAYDAMIAARNAEANLMNLNASLRQAELGTHGDTNALWAKQNVQGGQTNPKIPNWVKHSIDLSMTLPLALSDAFPISYKGPIAQPIRGGAVIDLGIHTGIDWLNWQVGNGDGVTFAANTASNVVSTGSGVAAGHLFGKALAGIFGAPLGPKGKIASYAVGYVVGVVVTEMGVNEPIEQVLRHLDDRGMLTTAGMYQNYEGFKAQRQQMENEYNKYQTQRYDYLKQIENPQTWNSERLWLNNRLKNEKKGNYWTGVKG